MSDYCGTIYTFEVPDDHGRMEQWAAFYNVDDEMFVAEWVDTTAHAADHAAGAATADALQTSVGGRIPDDVLTKLADSAAHGQRVITITVEDDGARLFGAPRDENTAEVLTANRWHRSDVDRCWTTPPAQDTTATTSLIETTARSLRDAGHHVEVLLWTSQTNPTHRS